MPTLSDDPREREAEEKCLADVEQYGLHIMHVHGDDAWPRFSYSIGLFHSFKAPEIIIIGLRTELAQWILNELAARARDGQQYGIHR